MLLILYFYLLLFLIEPAVWLRPGVFIICLLVHFKTDLAVLLESHYLRVGLAWWSIDWVLFNTWIRVLVWLCLDPYWGINGCFFPQRWRGTQINLFLQFWGYLFCTLRLYLFIAFLEHWSNSLFACNALFVLFVALIKGVELVIYYFLFAAIKFLSHVTWSTSLWVLYVAWAHRWIFTRLNQVYFTFRHYWEIWLLAVTNSLTVSLFLFLQVNICCFTFWPVIWMLFLVNFFCLWGLEPIFELHSIWTQFFCALYNTALIWYNWIFSLSHPCTIYLRLILSLIQRSEPIVATKWQLLLHWLDVRILQRFISITLPIKYL